MKKQATKPRKTAAKKRVETITHGKQLRPNIPTAEMEGLVAGDKKKPIPADYKRKHNPQKTPAHYKRNADLDPQLVWMGKDEEDHRPLIVDAMPIYVQEKIQPLAIIEDLQQRPQQAGDVGNLFTDFNGLSASEGVQFYQHAQKWTNRMILGDSLKVMASLARKEDLRGKVQCVYVDPPYGINYSSNWQPSTRSRAVKGNDETHEVEMIRAFRDTWKLGINSYLSYLRDRLAAAHDLLTESGSVFLQISDENVHLVRSVMDEIFRRENFVSLITFTKTNPLGSSSKRLARTCDYLIWYAKNIEQMKYNPLFFTKKIGKNSAYQHVELANGIRRKMTTEEKSDISLIPPQADVFSLEKLFSTGYTKTCFYEFEFNGRTIERGSKSWRTTPQGMTRLIQSGRIHGDRRPAYVAKSSDFPMRAIDHLWNDTGGATDMVYVVQTSAKVIQRCMLMTTDPGDLVLDPTCGSGTTASVAEQWGRRWITCDTSRVALALARARLMSNVYPYYLLKDSKEGADKETQLSKQPHGKTDFADDVQKGFVYERVPHITLRDIAQNAEISEIHARYQDELETLRKKLNTETKNNFAEWEIPRDIPEKEKWSKKAKDIHVAWWKARITRQQKIDKSIAKSADTEMLVDRPYEARNTVRVSGPFTVESLSPHRVIPPSDAEDSSDTRPKSQTENESRFWDIVYESLKDSGVQNTRKGEHLKFTELDPWPGGEYIQFAGRYLQKNGKEKKVAVCVGPEYDTVTRTLLIDAAREAADMFDVLVVLGFAFEAYADEKMASLGNLSVERVRMNSDLHMGDRLASGKAANNLFVSLGEPDIEYRSLPDDMIEVEISGIDIFDPTTGELTANGVGDIACWMIDTDYNGQSFFVRHAYFCGTGKDPYKQLKKALKAEISLELWDTLRASVSRPFAKPKTGKIAVKAINHHGDEVMRVFSIT